MLTRAGLVTTVAQPLQDVLDLGGVLLTDTAGAMKEPVDDTFRHLNVAEADLLTAEITDGNERKAIAYLRYFTLERVLYAVAAKRDVSAKDGVSSKASQQYDHVAQLLGRAAQAAQLWGLVIPLNGQNGLPATAAFTGDVSVLFTLDDLPFEPSEFRSLGEFA